MVLFSAGPSLIDWSQEWGGPFTEMQAEVRDVAESKPDSNKKQGLDRWQRCCKKERRPHLFLLSATSLDLDFGSLYLWDNWAHIKGFGGEGHVR